jgi:hypothetical protein
LRFPDSGRSVRSTSRLTRSHCKYSRVPVAHGRGKRGNRWGLEGGPRGESPPGERRSAGSARARQLTP